MIRFKYGIISIVLAFLFYGCSSNITNKREDLAQRKTSENVIVNTEKAIVKIQENEKEEKVQEKSDVNNMHKEDKENNVVKKEKVESIKEKEKGTVVIDPGHGNKSNLEKEPTAPGSSAMKIKDGGGATGINSKTPEYIVNMEVAVRLKKILEEKGFNVIMTKTEHSEIPGNIERAEIGNNANADLVLRIHCDSVDNPSAKGASMLVPQPINDSTKSIYDQSKVYGEIVLDYMSKEVNAKNRGLIFTKDMTGFNWSKVPVILVEMGFLSNPEEDKLLTSPEYQDKLALGLAKGIEEALKK